MPDNWSFVAAAYGLTALVLGLYWRRLVRKEKELRRGSTTTGTTTGSAPGVAGTARAHTERTRQSFSAEREIAERSRQPSSAGHPRPDPTTRGPLQQ